MSAITVIASADHAGKGPGVAVDVTNFCTLRLDFTVASVSASARPLLDVWLETSADGSTGWAKLCEFQTANAASSQRVVLSNHDNYVRANWLARSQVLGAEPGCTWGVTGEGLPDAA